MANGPLLTEIRIPLVMTTDASRAVRGMQQARAQLGKIGDGLKGWGAGQIGGLGGMLSGYLGIQGALSGIRMLMDEAERLRGISAKWSPTAAKAHAETQVAEMQSERIVGQAVAPEAVAIEERKAESARHASSKSGIASAKLVLSAAEKWAMYKEALQASALTFGHLATGNIAAAESEAAFATKRFEDSGFLLPERDVPSPQQGAISMRAELQRIALGVEATSRNTGGTR